ncbi:hypothetical protein IMZ48_19560, partial [Candidatus Bathyarchaeota archaeon]|nr:hypothetical protein [Candidatus Bathyarchaeota archaeon]
MASRVLVGDLVENDTVSLKPLSEGDFQSPATGFPAPKKRVSAFKQRKAAAAGRPSAPAGASVTTPQVSKSKAAGDERQDFYATEKRKIDQENRERVQAMSYEEVEEARAELMTGLSPEMVERLFKRANIDGQLTNELPTEAPAKSRPPPPTIKVEDTTTEAPASQAPEKPAKQTPYQARVESEDEDGAPEKAPKQPASNQARAESVPKGGVPVKAPKQPAPTQDLAMPFDEDRAPEQPPADLFSISDAPKSTHFPVPHDPELDPSDPDFLESLHKKYFPNLAADPSKLAWMAPLPTEGSQADQESPYYPGQSTL